VSYGGFSTCRFGCAGAVGSRELTDGVWLWPEGLGHYVETHAICLPDDFLAHARQNSFRLPEDARQNIPRFETRLPYSAHCWMSWANAKGALR
jgi:hypothetical protein